jgi:hypothetical protein
MNQQTLIRTLLVAALLVVATALAVPSPAAHADRHASNLHAPVALSNIR